MLHFTDHSRDAQDAHDLCGNRRNGGTLNAKTERSHQQEIPHDIQDGAKNQHIQRPFGITEGSENTRHHIVEHHCPDTAEVNPGIGKGLRINILGYCHDVQQLRRKDHAGNGTEHTKNQRQRTRGADAAAKAFFILCAVVAGNQDGCTCRQTVHEVNRKLKQGVHGIDGGKSHLSRELPYNHRVRCGIELLDKTSQNHRNDKGSQYFGNASSGQIQFFTHDVPLQTKTRQPRSQKGKGCRERFYTTNTRASTTSARDMISCSSSDLYLKRLLPLPSQVSPMTGFRRRGQNLDTYSTVVCGVLHPVLFSAFQPACALESTGHICYAFYR